MFIDTDAPPVVQGQVIYTANVLYAEYTDVCLCSKFKNKHWLFLDVFVYNGQQISCCFYFEPNTKFTKKYTYSIKSTKKFLLF